MQFFRRILHRLRSRDGADGAIDKSNLPCIIQYLDQSEAKFNVNKQSLGRELYERVYNDLDFQYEHEYFGLQYTDFHNVRYWLDPTKSLKKQVKKTMPGPPYTFRFVVKFFSSEPDTYLREELTRYLYVLQLKSDLADGKLTVTDDEKAAELAALVIQSEEGDFDPEKHDLAFVSQFHFLPADRQTEEFELMVFEEYRKLADRNLNPALCEKMYLNKVKYLDNYGVDTHKVQGKDDRIYQLGLTPGGILVYDGEEKIGFFFWQRIVKIAFSRASLKIVVSEDDAQGAKQDHTFVFKLADTRTCKHLWRCAVEHHSFFRLVQPRAPPGKAKQLLRLRSRFYHSFRTETSLVQANQLGTSQRRSARFERKPSTRHSSRPSFTRADADRQRTRRSAAQRPAAEPGYASVIAEVQEPDPSQPQSDTAADNRPEKIETRAIIVTTGIPDEDDDDADEAEFNSFDAVLPQSPLPAVTTSHGAAATDICDSQRSRPPALPVAPAASPQLPADGSRHQPLNWSPSGQSDSDASALSQRTVIEVPTPQQPEEEEAALTAAKSTQLAAAVTASGSSGRRPPQASGIRPPAAIAKTAAPAAPATSAPAAANNGVGKSLSTSALPAPKVLVQKPQPQPQPQQQQISPPTALPVATVSASSLPRRLSSSGASASAADADAAAAAASSRIPYPTSAATASALPPPGRSRIPAPAPPPLLQAAPATHSGSSSGLPQPRAGVSSIPRLATANAPTPVVGPQFSLKL